MSRNSSCWKIRRAPWATCREARCLLTWQATSSKKWLGAECASPKRPISKMKKLLALLLAFSLVGCDVPKNVETKPVNARFKAVEYNTEANVPRVIVLKDIESDTEYL